MDKKDTATCDLSEHELEIQKLAEKYIAEMNQLGITYSPSNSTGMVDGVYKKVSVLNSEGFFFINSSQLKSTSGI